MKRINLMRRNSMFSAKANHVSPAFTTELNAKIADMKRNGIEVVRLNIGEPDFHTPDNINAAAKAAIDEHFTRYTPVNGIFDLREAIARKFKRDNGVEYTPDEICAASGAKQALYEAVLTLAGQGDEVIIPVPCWVCYVEMVKLADAVPVQVPVQESGPERNHLDLEAIRKAITPRTKAIIINTPNNPTGVVYTRKELTELAELAAAHDFWIISDEVYEKLLYDGAEHICMAAISDDAWNRSIVINGCSKTYAMTGWRLGYAAGPAAAIKKLRSLQSHITGGITSITQKAGVEALNGPQESVETMRRAFDERRIKMSEMLGKIPHISFSEPQGAFYYLVDISWYFGKKGNGKIIHDALEFAPYLLDTKRVAVVPGDAFFAPGTIRLSYSNSLDNLEKGVKGLAEALAAME